MNEIEVGDKVSYNENGRCWHDEYPIFFPSQGTEGVVLGIYKECYLIKWADNSTSNDDIWCCDKEWVYKLE